MSKLDFIIVFALASDRMVDIIQVFLDNQLGYFYCMGVLQARVVSPRVWAGMDRSRNQIFSVWGSRFPGGFQWQPMNLVRGHSRDYYSHNNWYWFWYRERLRENYIGCLCMSLGRFRIRYD